MGTAAIRDVASSGKMMLALAKAQGLARNGTRMLFICCNRSLKDWLCDTVPESIANDLVVDTYLGITNKLCEIADVPLCEMGDTNSPEIWNELAPNASMQARERLGWRSSSMPSRSTRAWTSAICGARVPNRSFGTLRTKLATVFSMIRIGTCLSRTLQSRPSSGNRMS